MIFLPSQTNFYPGAPAKELEGHPASASCSPHYSGRVEDPPRVAPSPKDNDTNHEAAAPREPGLPLMCSE